MDEAMELRQAQPQDAGSIRFLTREAYAKWVPVIGREPRPMTADYEEAVRKHRFDLLFVDGVLTALIETVDEPDQLLIENVAVSPGFQGRGLGRMLLVHAEQLAVSLGHGRIRLYTNKRFTENVRLYRRVGYRIDREEEIGDAIAVHMSKEVGPRSTSLAYAAEKQATVDAAMVCLEAFTDRFNDRDIAGMDALLHFPHIILSDETLTVWRTPGQLRSSFFDEMAATIGWCRSTYHSKEAVLAGPRKVHLLVRYSRDREDGSEISRHDNLWIVTFENGRWGIKLRSY